MQSTARRRYYAWVYLASLLISVTLGAAFGHITEPSGGVTSYVHGAVAGILIPSMIVPLELFVFEAAAVRSAPFLLYLSLRSLSYLAAILIGLAATAWLLQDLPAGRSAISRSGIIFALAMGLGFNLLYGVNRLLGQARCGGMRVSEEPQIGVNELVASEPFGE